MGEFLEENVGEVEFVDVEGDAFMVLRLGVIMGRRLGDLFQLELALSGPKENTHHDEEAAVKDVHRHLRLPVVVYRPHQLNLNVCFYK